MTVCGGALAATIRATDLDDGPLDDGQITTYTNETFISGGDSTTYNRNESIKVDGNTTFGGSGSGYTLNLQRIETVGSGIIEIRSAGSAGVHVSVQQLNPASGSNLTINLSAGTGQQNRNRFTVNSIDVNSSLTVNVDGYSTFVNDGGSTLGSVGGSTGVFTLNLKETTSEASLRNKTLINGTIGGKGYLAVGNGLKIRSGAGGTATLKVDGVLNVITDLGSSTRGDIILGNGDATTYLNITSGGELIAGEITIGSDVMMTGTTGSINASSLWITDDFTELDRIDMKVSGLVTVDKDVTYTVAGTGDEFSGGMDLFGTLTNSGSTTITFGKTVSSLARLNVVDGTIKANSSFTIDNADIVIMSKTANPWISLDASTAKLDLGTSDVTVALDRNSTFFAVNAGIDINNYHQLYGDVTLDGGGAMTVLGNAAIGDASAGGRVALNLTAGTRANFQKGLVLDRYGSLVALGNSTVNLGSSGANGDLHLVGDNALVGDLGQLTINSAGSTRKFTVSGHNNIAHGDVDASGFDLAVNAGGILNVASDGAPGLSVRSASVAGRLDLGTDAYNDVLGDENGGYLTLAGNMVISSGGIVAANFDDAHITTLGANRAFTVEQGGSLIAETGTIHANNFSGIAINGSFTAGWKGDDPSGAVAKLIANSSVVIGSTGTISVTKGLAKYATEGLSLIDVTNGTITNNGNWGYMSMYGKMRFGLAAGDTQLIIEELSNQLNGTEEENRRQALANLREMWGENQIRDDFGNIIYNLLENPSYGPVPADSIAGNKNMGLFEALGNPDAKNVGISTLEYMNGAYVTGITAVGMETSHTFVSDISNRTKVVRRQFVAAAEITGSDALATTAMNSNYANRLWVDAHGLWQTGDGRQGFSGYSYDATGFTIGYDRALLCPLAIGFAGAYNDGDYEDKGAISSDSKIESFSAGGYATYSDLGGAYATLYGGYTYSDNDIRDLRQDPTTIDGTNSWATAHFRTETINVGMNLGYDLRPTDGLVVTPSVGINYIHAKNSDYTSFLGDVGNQKVVNSRNRSIYIPLEMSVQYDTCLANGGKLRLEVNGGYSYDLRESSMRGDIQFLGLTTPNIVGITGPTNSRHSYRLGGSVRYGYNNYDIGARYDYIGKDGYNAHRISATLGMSF